MQWHHGIASPFFMIKLFSFSFVETQTQWSRAEGSIPDHDPHTPHIASVSTTSESSKTTIRPWIFPSRPRRFSPTLHLVCMCVVIFVHHSPPSPPRSAYSEFSPQLSALAFSQCLSAPLILSSITICTDFFRSSLLCLSSLRCLQLWPWQKSAVIRGRHLSKCKWWRVEAAKRDAPTSCTQWAVAPGGRLIYWEGSRGFPGGRWPTSQLSLLLAAADMVTSSTHGSSHWEDIMGIMAGLTAVIGVFFSIPPLHTEKYNTPQLPLTFSNHWLHLCLGCLLEPQNKLEA